MGKDIEYIDKIIILGSKASMQAITTQKPKLEVNSFIKRLVSDMLKSQKKLIVGATLSPTDYDKLSADKELINTQFFTEETMRRWQDYNNKKGLFKFIARYKASMDTRYQFRYYFILKTEEQIHKFVPLSTIGWFDQYFIYLPEEEVALKQKLLNRASIEDIAQSCYVVIPNFTSCTGLFEYYILSNHISESEFRIFTEVAFESSDIRYLTEEEKEKIFKEDVFIR